MRQRLTENERRILIEAARIKRRLNESAEKTPEQVEIGDIFVSSWGYEQTNINFYQVIGKTGSGKSVTLAPMSKERVGSSGYENKVVPGVIERGIQPLKRRLSPSSWRGVVVRIHDNSFAYPWSGKPESETASGYGH
jgi:hypothetical protein